MQKSRFAKVALAAALLGAFALPVSAAQAAAPIKGNLVQTVSVNKPVRPGGSVQPLSEGMWP